MTSRERILERLRRSALPAVVAPQRYAAPVADPLHTVDRLRAQLEAAGATSEIVHGESEIEAQVRAIANALGAQRVVSTLAGTPSAIPAPTVREPDDPHSFDDVDLAVARGHFAVVENGAIWVDDAALPQRALLFLAQHLVLVVGQSAIEPDLHAGYARLERERQRESADHERGGPPALGARPWACFIAGPSKTADIEQALVIGAHGPRSLHVLIVANG